jgi:hypothetical protein
MPFFKKRFGARTLTGSRIGEVQRIFRDIYNLGGRHWVNDLVAGYFVYDVF